jgi:hypothetical protein
MNLIEKLPLSTSDFISGRFDQLCKYVQENWRYNKAISFEDAKNKVAITLGYLDYMDAINSATNVFPKNMLAGNNHFFLDPIGNLAKIIYGDKIGTSKSFDDAMLLVNRNKEVTAFYRSWPNHLISRWKFEETICNLSDATLSDLEHAFDSYWCNNSVKQYTFGTLPGRSTSAATITAAMDSWISIDKINNSTIMELIDPEISEKLFQDAMSETLRNVFEESWASLCFIFSELGFSPEDARALQKNESGFPNLYSHMRVFLDKVILARKAISLFTYPRNKSGFFCEPHKLSTEDVSAKDHYPLDQNYFVFSSYSDHCEPSSFRSHSWEGQIQNDSGEVLAFAKGSYFSGPAKKESGGGELISAADSVGDQDLETIDFVLSNLQQEIFEQFGESVEKQYINMLRLFCDGNLITIAICERSQTTSPGIGTDLISECLTRLKVKYKRNFHVASMINPLQYRRDSSLSMAITDQRVKDSIKIINKLNHLSQHPNVLNMYLGIHGFHEGTHTAFLYMQGNAG